ncbi:hypothetical protein MLD38_003831 [Melastoma candidum]|uniref:Uncharacterized protein n=2 Tax=Melastoma candidum TaxID=119954 RepID=A0ACB9S3T8_9MYRT|nr:hypothetical protein MLD38_003831 [Melastoma candidum]
MMEGDRGDKTPLLEEIGPLPDHGGSLQTRDGSVDVRGTPALRTTTGNWKSVPFILGTECCERLAFNGIGTNLITYLTGKLHQGKVPAAVTVSTWAATCYLMALAGAILADAYWGRYRTIAIFSIIHFTGMFTLTLSTTVPGLMPLECVDSVCPNTTATQYAVFYIGLYLIALGTGGIKPCVPSFGADQFDDTDAKEKARKASFFNWYYFSINTGALASSTLIVWIQENIGWGLGFGIPTLFMGIAVASFFTGTLMYRFQKPGGSPITRMCQVVVAAFLKRNVKLPGDSCQLYETQDGDSTISGSRRLQHSDGYLSLDKAAVVTDAETKNEDFSNRWRLCTVTQVEELKILIRMFPIWATGIVFFAVHSQMSTMFIEQGMMMNRTVGSFTIPAASLVISNIISVVFWIPVYDRLLLPLARRFTGNREKGFSELQRMGIGLFISVLSMSAAALVEIRRLRLANELGLVDKDVPVPMSILWQIPQYFLNGASEVFTAVGQIQFFYEQSPDSMRSLGSALALLTISFGVYLSAFVLRIVTAITAQGESTGWIPDNLNEGHLDRFFWMLAGLSVLNMAIYMVCAMRYKQKKVSLG